MFTDTLYMKSRIFFLGFGFLSKRIKSLSVFYPRHLGEILQTHQSPVIYDLCLRESGAGKSRFKNVFRPHESEKQPFQIPRFKSVFEEFQFCDGLVWTVGLAVEVQLRFQISPEPSFHTWFYSCYWRWARCQIFLCLERHTNEAKGSIQNWPFRLVCMSNRW